MRLLSENAIVAGLPPDFTVLDQPAADRMRREAAEEASGRVVCGESAAKCAG